MAKSVSVPMSLSDLRGGSARLPNRKIVPKALPGFVLSVVETGDGQAELYGSSADRAGLALGDQVIAVNGTNVEGKSHEQLVQFVQQCIRTRSVSLRVRRKKRLQPTSTPTALKEAFLVAVNKDDQEGILERINQKYPEARAFDMEDVAAKPGPPQELAKVHNGSASTSVNGDHVEEEERLKRYDSDIRDRKERQIQRQKENELLRSSLRASKKLKNLSSTTSKENNNTPEVQETSVDAGPASSKDETKGYANECYIVSDSSYRENLDKAADSLPLDQIILSVERIADHLSTSEGRQDDSKLIREFFSSDPIKSAIAATAVHHRPAECPSTTATSTATHAPTPRRSQQPTDEPGPAENLRVVTLFKEDNSYLGATVRLEDQRLIVGRIVAGGIAESSGLLQEGDELLEVNGLDLRGRNVGQVCDVLRSLRGQIRIVVNIEGRKGLKERRGSIKRLRALFDYDPQDDIFVPCRELALSFHKGDVLHVLDTSDQSWWQATLDGRDSRGCLAGIIPSPSFRQQVLLYNEEHDARPKSRKEAKKLLPEVMNTWKKKNKEQIIGDEHGTMPLYAHPSAYEEVALHLARSSHKRTLVLCAPEGVGCLQLRQALLEGEPDRLAAPVPHTSRAPKEGEVNGVHYHFVSRGKILEMSKAGQLVEFGEFEKNLYGTALEDILSVKERGKTCVLTLKPQSLLAVRTPSVMPFVVFIAPPTLAQLRRQRELAGQHGCTDDQLKAVLAQGKAFQQQYGHLFDAVLINTEATRSIEELRKIINRLDTEPFWVPAYWVNDRTSTDH